MLVRLRGFHLHCIVHRFIILITYITKRIPFKEKFCWTYLKPNKMVGAKFDEVWVLNHKYETE